MVSEKHYYAIVYARSQDNKDLFFSELANSIEREAYKRDYILKCSFYVGDLDGKDFCAALKASEIKGLVVLGRFDQERIKTIAEAQKNVVYVSLNPTSSKHDLVFCDGYKASLKAMETLLELGHHNIASIMIKPVSSVCNMCCKYCFYADISRLRTVPSFGIMSKETTDAVLEHIFADLDPGDALSFVFQGGEPTVAGLGFFSHFVEETGKYQHKGVYVQYALQTNGLVLDEEWCAFLKKHNFLVGLSLDGPAEYHDSNRLDSAGKRTFRRVMKAKLEMDRFGVDYNVIMVLTSQMARHSRRVWRFIQEQKIDYVQFIPCLGDLEKNNSLCALTPQRYAEFYTGLFDLWLQSYQQGAYVSIKLFDDLVGLLARGRCSTCGLLGQCQPQLIVEANGSVYPCDFYVLDCYQMGNLSEEFLHAVYESQVMLDFLRRERADIPLCENCPYKAFCGGGCPRMQYEVFYRPGDAFCGHRAFLDYSIGGLQEIARQHCTRNPVHRYI